MSDGYLMRRMERPELDLAIDLAAAEGWNPGLGDAEAFWAADPQGFHIGLLEGRPAATLSGVRYADQGRPAFDFIGLYIVLPGLRGRGFGKRLWDHVLDGLSAPTVALDAVTAQEATYRKDGFETFRKSVRHAGDAGVASAGLPGDWLSAPGLRPLSEFPWPEVLAYDRRCFPAPREGFLRAWTSLPGHVALGLERGGPTGGRLAGFGVVRPCGTGSKIGPLFADDEEAARTLLRALCASAPTRPVHFDTPGTNPSAAKLAGELGLRPVFETVRMYRGPAPDVDLDREFGVTSFELG